MRKEHKKIIALLNEKYDRTYIINGSMKEHATIEKFLEFIGKKKIVRAKKKGARQ